LVKFPNLLGSFGFLIGSFLVLIMWKSESYGLAFISDLNVRRTVDTKKQTALLKSQEQYGCGRSDMMQAPWICIYVCFACVSVVQVGLCVKFSPGVKDPTEIDLDLILVFTSIIDFLLAHGTLCLASVVHHTPTASPHNLLLAMMRFCILAYTILITVNCVYGVQTA